MKDEGVDLGPLGCFNGLGIVPSNCFYVYKGAVHGQAEDHHSGVMALPLFAEDRQLWLCWLQE